MLFSLGSYKFLIKIIQFIAIYKIFISILLSLFLLSSCFGGSDNNRGQIRNFNNQVPGFYGNPPASQYYPRPNMPPNAPPNYYYNNNQYPGNNPYPYYRYYGNQYVTPDNYYWYDNNDSYYGNPNQFQDQQSQDDFRFSR